MTLPTLVALAEAVQQLQKEVGELKRRSVTPPKGVYGIGGIGTGVTDHGGLTGLGDDDHTQYVPVDGVARQLANAGYPNALLLNGSRAMTGALNLDEIAKGITFGSSGAYIQGETAGDGAHIIRIVSEDELKLEANIDSGGQSIFRSFFTMYPSSDAGGIFYMRINDTASHILPFKVSNDDWGWETVAKFAQGAAGLCRFDIPQAGDITMLTDKMIQLSNETAAPACNVANRGKIRFIHGGAGVADVEQRCMKAAAGTYSWVQTASG